jgi:hypothetical protein
MVLIAAAQISGSYESESERLDVMDSSDTELRLAAEEPFSIGSPADGKALSSVPGSAVWVCIVVISCISEQIEAPGSLGAGRYNFGLGQDQHLIRSSNEVQLNLKKNWREAVVVLCPVGYTRS